MKDQQIKPLEEEIDVLKVKNNRDFINIASESKRNTTKKENNTVDELPSWSIEPPLEINRRQE